MERQEIPERRKSRRFRAEENTFALLRGRASKLGRVIDISNGGLAFRYVSLGERLRGPLQLDLVPPHEDLRLNKLPVRVVSNFEIESKTPSGLIRLRRVGVQFGGLTRNQRYQLDQFIRNYTAGDV